MRIDTETKTVSVEIEGTTYPVAKKTAAAALRLAQAASSEQGDKPQYQTWLDQLRVMLGEPAVVELFPNGENEDLDRMEAIYAGAMEAFDYNGKAMREKREQAEIDHLHDLANTLSTIADKTREIIDRYPGIMRPKSTAADQGE